MPRFKNIQVQSGFSYNVVEQFTGATYSIDFNSTDYQIPSAKAVYGLGIAGVTGVSYSDFNTHTGNTSIHFTKGSIYLSDLGNVNTGGTLQGYYLSYSAGTWVGIQDSTDLSNYYNKQQVYNTGQTLTTAQINSLITGATSGITVDLTAYYTTAQTYSNTQVDVMISGLTFQPDNYFTSAQTVANFLSANTSFYTQSQANNNFLSANTSFYTQQQANNNFLSATTTVTDLGGYTSTVIDGLITGVTIDLSGYYTSAQTDYLLSTKSTTGHTHSQYALLTNLESHTADTSIHFTEASISSHYLSANTNLAQYSITSHTHFQTSADPANYIYFNSATTTPTFKEGGVYYDQASRTLVAMMGDETRLNIGTEEVEMYYNDSASNILNGQAVYITGANGTYATIALAQANDYNTASVCGVATQNIPIGSYGYVTTRGQVHDMNTTGSIQGQTWSNGTKLYLHSLSAGTLSNQQTTEDGKIDVVVGYVIYSHATAGIICVELSTNRRLTDLSDVTISGATSDQVLFYNGTQWINKSISVGAVAGNGVDWYLDNASSGIGAYDNILYSPSASTEVIESAVLSANTALFLIDGYITPVLGRTVIEGGNWEFNTYRYVNATAGVTTMTIQVYQYQSGGTETLLFSVTGAEINDTVNTLGIIDTIQPAFNINTTDRIVIKYYGSTTAAPKTISMSHNGTLHYSHIHTPLVTKHNDLAGLNAGDYKHLTATEYTSTVNHYGNTSNPHNVTAAQVGSYTTTQSNANFLSANTSYYTQAQSNANFLSANTSYYTQSQTNNLLELRSKTGHTHNQYLTTATTFASSLSGLSDVTITSLAQENMLVYSGTSWQNKSVAVDLTGYYTSSQTNTNFLSANTSYYTQSQSNNNFLSANTSFYTQAQSNANFLSANTSYYTQAQANSNFASGLSFRTHTGDTTIHFTKASLSGDFLSANTSYYTQAQSNANFLSANTSYYTQSQVNNNFLSANTSYYTQTQANSNFLTATTIDQFNFQIEFTTGISYYLINYSQYALSALTLSWNTDVGTATISLSGGSAGTTAIGGLTSITGGTTVQHYAATSANGVPIGNKIKLRVDSIASSAATIYGTMKIQRT